LLTDRSFRQGADPAFDTHDDELTVCARQAAGRTDPAAMSVALRP
jgi:hypothetical protein